jgi:hypothetical protein
MACHALPPTVPSCLQASPSTSPSAAAVPRTSNKADNEYPQHSTVDLHKVCAMNPHMLAIGQLKNFSCEHPQPAGSECTMRRA